MIRSEQDSLAGSPDAEAIRHTKPLRILILGLNHAPEPVGIGPYTAEMAAALAEHGHDVEVVTSKPYYPSWRVDPADKGLRPARSVERGVRITRCPLYVPREPSGVRRVVHHLSFAASAAVPLLRAARRQRPDVVMTIAPSMIAAPLARLAARMAGARSWLHIQDFEVGAAFATGLLRRDCLAGRAADGFEHFAYDGFDRYSSISPQMCSRLAELGVPQAAILEFRNWADVEAVTPMAGESPYRAQWGITTRHVALYSGNIANKQGIDILIEAARRLAHRGDLTFLICGEGPNRARLEAAAEGLSNVRFEPLQPRERLGDLLGLATIHLLPQLAGAADLVLPSKLTNMLASGRPVVATADPGTGLAAEVEGCGIVTAPGDADALSRAIATLADDPALHAELGRAARQRAEERWSKRAILGRFEAELRRLATRS